MEGMLLLLDSRPAPGWVSILRLVRRVPCISGQSDLQERGIYRLA